MLSPDDHETNFISLSRMTQEQPYNIKIFMSKEHEYDETSVFMYLVRTKRLKINFFIIAPQDIFLEKFF